MLPASILTDAINFIVVPSEPRSLEVIHVNSTSATLQWRPPTTLNGVITQYSILYNGINVTNFGSNMLMDANNMLMDTIEGLSPDTVYVLELRAHTGAGAGPSSSITFLTCKLCNMTILSSSMYVYSVAYHYSLTSSTVANAIVIFASIRLGQVHNCAVTPYSVVSTILRMTSYQGECHNT